MEPPAVDLAYLQALGVQVEPSADTLAALRRGKELFRRRLSEHTLLPQLRCNIETLDTEHLAPEIHNYTGRCPTLTYEINPVRGCGVGCQYCLVTDGVHEQTLTAFENYPDYVARLLDRYNGPASPNERHYYYFSPKTEALQEATLQTGIAHGILRAFITHFRRHPSSQARLFVASKAGARHLLVRSGGESVLDLFVQLAGKMQFNTSVSMMPSALRSLLEPYAAPIEERLSAVRLCRENGVLADSALVQPIFPPFLSDERIREFFEALRDAGIRNYKPEFLTVCMENLAMIAPLLGHFDKAMERRLYEDYLLPSNAGHRKQRGRTAPDRALSVSLIEKMKRQTDALGLSVSICYWVRTQLGITEAQIPLINAGGFQCLGYQSRLCDDVR
ncbi:MAG: hypothetical protein IJ636_03375 [Bacteroidales bacterium]|nr:hypothetical protein [Bacteroidales bacterium]